jgi:hypothetical protein
MNLSFNIFPSDIMKVILNKLDNFKDLQSFSYVSKYNYNFCKRNKNLLLEKYNADIYAVMLQEIKDSIVINNKIHQRIRYKCSLCLGLYEKYNNYDNVCVRKCIDCPRTFCINSGHLIPRDNYFSREPVKLLDDKTGDIRLLIHGNLIYRCYSCHKYKYFTKQGWILK